MADLLLFPLNEQKIKLVGLTDDVGNVINTALVQATMKDLNGVVIPEINNVTLVSINTNGDYAYIVPATFNPAAAFGYVCVCSASVAGVPKLHIEKPVTVETRTS